MANVHDDVSEVTELSSTFRFGEEVTNHFISWAVVNCNMVTFLHIFNKKIPDLRVSSSFVTWRSYVCFGLLPPQAVLLYFCWSERISLSFEEATHQQYDGHVLVHHDPLGFS